MHRQDQHQEPGFTQPAPSAQRGCHQDDWRNEMDKSMAKAANEEDDIAVRSVLEMGYPRSKINSAVEQLRNQGNTKYSATDIMEIILDQEEHQTTTTTTTTASSSTSSQHTPGHAADGVKSIFSVASTDSQSLLKENQTLKGQMTCKICLDKDACIVYLPCGHMVTCQDCAPTIRKCCICRKLIQGTIKAYM